LSCWSDSCCGSATVSPRATSPWSCPTPSRCWSARARSRSPCAWATGPAGA